MTMRSIGIVSLALLTTTIVSLGLIGENAIGAETEADFTYSPDDPIVNEKITFDASDSTGEDLKFEWYFGDGDQDEGSEVTHIYERVGEYTVVLVIINETGEIKVDARDIEVREDPNGWWIGVLIGVVFGLCLPAFMMIGMVVSLIFGVIWSIRMYQSAKKHDVMKTAQPYLIGMVVMGIITWFLGWILFLLPLLGFFITYRLYKKKMRGIGIDIRKSDKKR